MFSDKMAFTSRRKSNRYVFFSLFCHGVSECHTTLIIIRIHLFMKGGETSLLFGVVSRILRVRLESLFLKGNCSASAVLSMLFVSSVPSICFCLSASVTQVAPTSLTIVSLSQCESC